MDLASHVVRLIVVSVGRLRPPYVDDVQHYKKLLARHARLELIEVREDEQVARRIPERAFVSLLARDGEAFDSLSFSRFLEDRRQSGRDLCFVIGGPVGLELPDVDHRFSLGSLTLPHQLARVVLLEQLLRGHKILANEPYHL
jgi:23S rRNA (pseudouridine1915-N3)-methyltransferase